MALDKLPIIPSRLGKYELLKEQAGSGLGTTWLARASDGDAARIHTIVRVPKHAVKKPEALDAFVAEVKDAERLSHPNAVKVTEVGSIDGEPFAASEYDEGESLSTLITVSGPQGLPLPVVLRIALDALEALSAAHGLAPPLVHGELTPQHVRVGIDGVTRIAGFGLARALSKLATIGLKNNERLAYAAPERVKTMASGGSPAPDARGDVFSMGVILWEALAKQRLFASRIEAAIIQKVLTAPIGGLAEHGVPAEVDEAVQKALERDPARRFQNVNDLIMGLEGAGPDKIATSQQVAALVEKLAGKSIAARRADLEGGTPKATPAAPSEAVAVPAPLAAKAAPPPWASRPRRCEPSRRGRPRFKGSWPR
jgi:eukaryotic-like serine/threonine-protein kinase